MHTEHSDHETLVEALNDEETLTTYKNSCDGFKTGFIPRLFGAFFVGTGSLVYGSRPSYAKFRAIEVIARVPYHSWASAGFTLLTVFYANEERALRLSTIRRFAEFASDNETMHVVVVSALSAKHGAPGAIRHFIAPMIFAFFFFWMSYLLYLIRPRWALELNYLFEQHAFDQYSQFLNEHEEMLKQCSMQSEFLAWYGRHPRSEYEFLRSVRNDEIVHRNRSVHEIGMHERR